MELGVGRISGDGVGKWQNNPCGLSRHEPVKLEVVQSEGIVVAPVDGVFE